MTTYKFPNVSFDWLGELPGISEEARLTRERKNALSDLNSTDPASMRKTASRLMATGGLKEMEMAIRLNQSALGQEELGRRKAEGAAIGPLQAEALSRLFGGGRGGTSPADSGGGPVPILPNVPQAQSPASAPPSPFNAPPGQLQSIPGLGPRSEAPPDIENAPPYQVAGPQVPPPQEAQAPAQPPWLQGAQMPAVPAAPPSAAAPPPVAIRPPPENASDAAIRQHAANVLGVMVQHGRKSPAYGALDKLYNNALATMKATPDEKAWHRENADRAVENKPPLSFREFKREEAVAPKVFEEAQTTAKAYEDEARGARTLKGNLDTLERIINHPSFVSGKGTALVGHGVSLLDGLRRTLIAAGVPADKLPNLEGVTEPVKLQEAGRAMSNLAVINKLGTLSRVTDADRAYVGDAFPALHHTVEGNKLLLRIQSAAANQSIEIGRLITNYRNDPARGGSKIRAEEINKIVDDYAMTHSLFKNKDGTLNELGRSIEEEKAKSAQPPPTGIGLVKRAISRAVAPLGDALRSVGEIIDPYSGKPRVGPFGARAEITGRADLGPSAPTNLSPDLNRTITPDREGKVYYDADGKPAGRIKNGQPTPFFSGARRALTAPRDVYRGGNNENEL